MNRVVDASVACKWFFEEHLSVEAQELAAARYVLLAPDLIIAECTNVAWRRVRDGQASPEQAEAFLKALPALVREPDTLGPTPRGCVPHRAHGESPRV